ncbi:MAG: TetR/AcrR family transcriptional regulator [Cycloclasticus sp.]|nr:TetR/AcrR family transcriptional regulator [Cycloclasticus sp.]
MLDTSKSKNKIITIAFKTFAAKGYSAVTMRSLAEKCGMTVSSLYHYFSSKSDLYDQVLDYIYSENSKFWSTPIETKGKNWEEQLKSYIYNFCRIMHNQPDYTQLLKREQLHGNPQRMEKLANSILADEYLGFEKLIQKVNPNCEAHIYVMTILGMSLHYYETSKFRRHLPDYSLKLENPDLVAEQITNILIGGIAYQPPTIS